MPSEDSDQPGHPPSLIRVFAVRMKQPWVLSYPMSAQRRLWSDWVPRLIVFAGPTLIVLVFVMRWLLWFRATLQSPVNVVTIFTANRLSARWSYPPPPGNFANISYLKEQSFLHRMFALCKLGRKRVTACYIRYLYWIWWNKIELCDLKGTFYLIQI